MDTLRVVAAGVAELAYEVGFFKHQHGDQDGAGDVLLANPRRCFGAPFRGTAADGSCSYKALDCVALAAGFGPPDGLQ